MNFLLSAFILFLSHAAYCSEQPQGMKRSDSTDTIDMCYTSEQHATKLQKKYTALKERNAQSEIQLEQANRNNAALTTQIALQQQRISNYENEEVENLSCSIVGPRFRSWPCFKSQPLSENIVVKKFRVILSQKRRLAYIDKHDVNFIKRLEPEESCCVVLPYLLCNVQIKLPQNVEIRPSVKHEARKAYFDKYTNKELDLVRYGTWYDYCYHTEDDGDHDEDR